MQALKQHPLSSRFSANIAPLSALLDRPAPSESRLSVVSNYMLAVIHVSFRQRTRRREHCVDGMTLTLAMDEDPPTETSTLLHNNGRWRVPSGLGSRRCCCACAIPSALALEPALISRDERQPGAFWYHTPPCEHVARLAATWLLLAGPRQRLPSTTRPFNRTVIIHLSRCLPLPIKCSSLLVIMMYGSGAMRLNAA